MKKCFAFILIPLLLICAALPAKADTSLDNQVKARLALALEVMQWNARRSAWNAGAFVLADSTWEFNWGLKWRAVGGGAVQNAAESAIWAAAGTQNETRIMFGPETEVPIETCVCITWTRVRAAAQLKWNRMLRPRMKERIISAVLAIPLSPSHRPDWTTVKRHYGKAFEIVKSTENSLPQLLAFYQFAAELPWEHPLIQGAKDFIGNAESQKRTLFERLPFDLRPMVGGYFEHYSETYSIRETVLEILSQLRAPTNTELDDSNCFMGCEIQ